MNRELTDASRSHHHLCFADLCDRRLNSSPTERRFTGSSLHDEHRTSRLFRAGLSPAKPRHDSTDDGRCGSCLADRKRSSQDRTSQISDVRSLRQPERSRCGPCQWRGCRTRSCKRRSQDRSILCRLYSAFRRPSRQERCKHPIRARSSDDESLPAGVCSKLRYSPRFALLLI